MQGWLRVNTIYGLLKNRRLMSELHSRRGFEITEGKSDFFCYAKGIYLQRSINERVEEKFYNNKGGEIWMKIK